MEQTKDHTLKYFQYTSLLTFFWGLKYPTLTVGIARTSSAKTYMQTGESKMQG